MLLRLANFKRNADGAVAVVFALSIIPVVLIIGCGIDIARQANSKVRLQTALDSAILSVAGSAETNLNEVVSKWVDAAYPLSSDVTDRAVEVTSKDGVVTGVATQRMPTSFMKLGGYDAMPIKVTSQVAAAAAPNIEVVLAIDTTYSMSTTLPGDTMTKFEGAKQATSELITRLFAKTSSHVGVKVGLVPFDWYVKAPLIYRNAPWIDSTADYSYTVPAACYKNVLSSTPVLESTYTYDCGVDGVPKTCTGYTYSYKDVVYGPDVCYPETTYTTPWSGCVGSRLTTWDTTAVTSADPEHGIIGNYCNNEFMRLSTDPAPLQAAISNYTMGTQTYIPAALMWSWRLLQPPSATEAFGDGGVPSNELKKYVVLLSDGANSVGPAGVGHTYMGTNPTTGEGVPTAEARMAKLCDNIKAAGIRIFTISFDNADGKANDLLRNCASGESFFYMSSNVTQLLSAFEKIGGMVASTRILK